MAQYGDKYGTKLTDEYGHPIRQTDEYGNPVQTTGGTTTMGGYGTGATGTYQNQYSAAGGYGGGLNPEATQLGLGGGQGQLRRSGSSSSSSSSEDDGMGGRRKKGLKQKIKEKLPGGHRDQAPAYSTGGVGSGYGTTQPGMHHEKGMMEKISEKMPGAAHGGHRDDLAYTAAGAGYGTHEKKGMMEKITEKLPGGTTGTHHDPAYSTTTGTTGTGYGSTTGTGGGAYGTHEKKGMMEKITEKLPGGTTGTHGTTHHDPAYSTTTGTGYGTTGEHHEKKGVMQKIKEKLPGSHHH